MSAPADDRHDAVPDGAGDLSRRAAVHAALGDPARLAVVDALRLSDRTPGELAAATDLASNLLAHHLGVLEDVGLVRRQRSEGDGRRRYVHLLVDPLELLAPRVAVRGEHVLFVCSRNAARSQLAAALWTRRTGRPAASAGATPAPAVDAEAVAVARSHGLDLSAARPLGWDAVGATPDLVVSVCDRAREARPPFDAPLVHWSVPDPAGHGPEAFEAALADLEPRVDRLARQVAA